MRKRSILYAFLIGLVAYLVYRATAAPDLLYGDSGEFQFTLSLAGVSHPTGYPFYHVLGWLWSRLFAGNPAQGANEFSAFTGGVAVAFFYLLCYEALAQMMAHLNWRRGVGWMAMIATILFAANPTFWAQNTRAEVYGLNAALMAAVLGATLATGRTDVKPGKAWPIALLLGIGLSHHLTFLLLIPGIVLYVWLVRPEFLRTQQLLRLLPFLLLPLLLYLFIPLRAGASEWLFPELTPGETLPLFDNSIGGNIRFIVGAGFAPALHGPIAAIAQIPSSAGLFLLHFGWLGLVLIVLGIVSLILEEQIPLLVLTAVSFLLLVVFNLFYGIGDIHTFYIPPYIIATLWLALGLVYLVELLTRATSNTFRPYYLGLSLLVLIIPLMHFQAYRDQFDRSNDFDARRTWSGILAEPLPDDAILVSNDRDEIVPLVYLQQIEEQAPSMNGVFPLMKPGSDFENLNATLQTALTTGRPVYTIKPMPGLEALYEVESIDGGVAHIRSQQEAPAESYESPYGEYLRWLGLDWRGDAVPGGTITVTVFWRVTETPPVNWHTFMQIYNEAGEKVKQADDHRPGGEYVPATLWRPGDVVVDKFTLPLPENLPPGGYAVVAGFYDPDTGARMADPLTVAIIHSPSSR